MTGMTLENGVTYFILGTCAATVLLAPLVGRFARVIRRRREEEEAALLREYPELAEILDSNRGG